MALKLINPIQDLDPLFAIYVDVQNKVADFFELFSELPHAQKFCDKHADAEDIYMPSYPPMSPVTNSFFTNWLIFDMAIGVKKETITSVMIDLYRQINASKELINLLVCMQKSYNGLYVHEGTDGNVVFLREIYTNELHKVFVQSGYQGQVGEVWLVRLLPSPVPEYLDYKVAFATPYVIVNIPVLDFGKKTSPKFYHMREWSDFIGRNLFKIKAKIKRSSLVLTLEFKSEVLG